MNVSNFNFDVSYLKKGEGGDYFIKSTERTILPLQTPCYLLITMFYRGFSIFLCVTELKRKSFTKIQ